MIHTLHSARTSFRVEDGYDITITSNEQNGFLEVLGIESETDVSTR